MLKRMGCRVVAFLGDERAEETTTSSIRMAIMAVIILGILGFVGAKVVYPMITKTGNCVAGATATSSSGVQTSGGGVGSC